MRRQYLRVPLRFEVKLEISGSPKPLYGFSDQTPDNANVSTTRPESSPCTPSALYLPEK